MPVSNMVRSLDLLSITQLARVYNRILARLGYGGCFGWDWPTLRAVYPEKYEALVAIKVAAQLRSL